MRIKSIPLSSVIVPFEAVCVVGACGLYEYCGFCIIKFALYSSTAGNDASLEGVIAMILPSYDY